jgi:hypothetical protein
MFSAEQCLEFSKQSTEFNWELGAGDLAQCQSTCLACARPWAWYKQTTTKTKNPEN